jgi:hypothetical protein
MLELLRRIFARETPTLHQRLIALHIASATKRSTPHTSES